VFAGRSASCAVPVSSQSAMRVQCVLVRTYDAAYVVDLVGRGTWRNDRPVRSAERLLDGDSLMVGSTKFQCRVEPPGSGASRSNLPAISLGTTLPARSRHDIYPASIPFPSEGPISPDDDMPLPPLDLVPVEAQAAVMGWLMNQIQRREDESNRRQSTFQTELVRLVSEIHRDNHAILQKHLERSQAIHDELETLRDEIKRRFGTDLTKSTANPAAPKTPALNAPKIKPLNINPVAPPDNPEAAANWLINRVGQLEQESRSSWKDLISRLSGKKPE
jgi:hypothetical protein